MRTTIFAKIKIYYSRLFNFSRFCYRTMHDTPLKRETLIVFAYFQVHYCKVAQIKPEPPLHGFFYPVQVLFGILLTYNRVSKNSRTSCK